MRPNTKMLSDAGVTLKAVAIEAGYPEDEVYERPKRHWNAAGRETVYVQRSMIGQNRVAEMLAGHTKMTPAVEAAIRALVPGPVAAEVVRLAEKSREARRG
jgi:hypothetical protein